MQEPIIRSQRTGNEYPFSACPTVVLQAVVMGLVTFLPEDNTLPTYPGIARDIAKHILAQRFTQ